jgi:hypothetical protein
MSDQVATLDEVKALYAVLRARCQFEVVSESVKPSQLRIVGRVYPAGAQAWLVLVKHLIKTAATMPWDIDISKSYFVREDDELRFGWRIILQAENIFEHIPRVISSINLVEVPPITQIMEVDLHASPLRHGMGAVGPLRGKGATTITGGFGG